eukprot:3161983-Rhodomonas_salina.1
MGLGLRAARDLVEGEIVGVYWGRAQKTISKRSLEKRHCYVVDYKDGVKLTAEKEGSLMRYVNSSCEPNVRLERQVLLPQTWVLRKHRSPPRMSKHCERRRAHRELLEESESEDEGRPVVPVRRRIYDSSDDSPSEREGRNEGEQENGEAAALSDNSELLAEDDSMEESRRAYSDTDKDDDDDEAVLTIIDQLEEGTDADREMDSNPWGDESELDGVRDVVAQGHAGCRAGRATHPGKRAAAPRTDGRWVKVPGRRRGQETFRWMASATPFDKQSARILRSMFLADSMEDHCRVRTWADLIQCKVGSLEAITRLVRLSENKGIQLRQVRVAKIGNDELFLNMLDTLLESRWVHSSVISAWHSLLTIQAPHICYADVLLQSHTTWIMDTTFYDTLTGVERRDDGSVSKIGAFSEERAIRSTRKQVTKHLGRIVIPINLNNRHWISVSLDLERKTLCVLDSLQGRHPTVEVNVQRWALVALGIQIEAQSIDYVPMPKQKDDDCAVFVMLFSLREACNWEGAPDVLKGVAYREAIARALLTGKLQLGSVGATAPAA